MLFHYIKDKNSTAYFEQAVLTIRGELHVPIFEASFNRLIEKYDILRTVFVYEKTKEPKQVVLKARKAKVYFEDLSALPPEEQQAYLAEFTARDRLAGFNLKKEIPMRVAILRCKDQEYKVVWSHHHIIMDGWCLSLVMHDFFRYYGELRRGETPAVTPAKPYSTFIKWLKAQDRTEALRYWQEALAGYEDKAAVPRARRFTGEYLQRKHTVAVGRELTAGLTRLAREQEVTVNSIFRTVWGLLLQTYNLTEDVVFGAVVSGRPSEIPGIESMVGLFINNVPVRVKGEPEDTLVGLVKKVQAGMIAAEAYNYLSLAEIQALTDLKHELIDHILVFENYPFQVQEALGRIVNRETVGFTIEQIEGTEQTNYDFGVVVLPGEEMRVELKYNSLTIDRAMVERMGQHLLQVLRTAVARPAIAVREMEIMTPEEKERILTVFNQPADRPVPPVTVHQMFARQAAAHPEQTALVCGEERLTYRELEERANRLARVLREKGVRPGVIVGLMVRPSADTVTGILGIMQAGGAYLPIDPEHPADRREYMLADSGSRLLLTQPDLLHELNFAGETVNIRGEETERADGSTLSAEAKPADPAYLIYTSGTTGQPKGVLLRHENLVNYVTWFVRTVGLSAADRGLLTSSFAFDLGYTSLYPTLLSGAALHLVTKETYLSGKGLAEYIRREGITYLKATPSLFTILVNGSDLTAAGCGRLRFVVLGGEEIQLNDLEKVFAACPDLRFMNHYGPTETTIGTIAQWVEREEFAAYRDLPTIGRPIDNAQIYILDKRGRLVPIGVAGEICVAGRGVGSGYLHRDELTRMKFIPNPFTEKREWIYRTGDRGRYLEDGRIQFLGRTDHQVKIRGYRVEPEEIASLIVQSGLVREAVVLAKEDHTQSKYLCAYYVAPADGEDGKGGTDAADSEHTRLHEPSEAGAAEKRELLPALKDYLQARVPDYMIPAYFVPLAEMPLTPNGKVDRRALPEPDQSPEQGAAYAAPRDRLEERLVTLWEELLGKKPIGIHDNFFELGGHSLKATIFVSRAHQELDAQIPLGEIFAAPTIAALAAYIRGRTANPYAAIEPVPEAAYYPISRAQKRLLIVNQKEGADISYNMAGGLTIEGPIDRERFAAAFRELIARHETLRTSFHLVKGEYLQKVHPAAEFAIEDWEADEERLDGIVQRFIRPFDLSAAPLLRVGLVKIAGGKHVLLFDMHHIISDGTSTGILIREFIGLYQGNRLPELTIQYKDFTAWHNRLLESELIRKQEEYWLGRFSGPLPVLNLPTDFPRPAKQSFAGKRIYFKLDRSLTQALKDTAREAGATLYMVLLAGYTVLLSRYTGQEDIIVGSPIAGRPHANLQNLIGMFINTLAMRNFPRKELTFREFLREVKANCLQVYENQDYPFEQLVERLNLRRDLSRNPLFDTAFTLQNMERTALELDGLRFTSSELEQNIAKFDLLILGIETGNEIEVILEYLTKLFRQSTVEKLRDHFIEVLTQVTANPDQPLREVVISYDLVAAGPVQMDEGDFDFPGGY